MLRSTTYRYQTTRTNIVLRDSFLHQLLIFLSPAHRQMFCRHVFAQTCAHISCPPGRTTLLALFLSHDAFWFVPFRLFSLLVLLLPVALTHSSLAKRKTERCFQSGDRIRRQGQPPLHPKRPRPGQHRLQGSRIHGGIPRRARLGQEWCAWGLWRALREVRAPGRVCHLWRAAHPHRHGRGQLFHAPRVVR